MKIRAFPSFIALSMGAAFSPAFAAPFYWDGTSSTVDANGGNGTWDTAATNWDTAATAGTDTAWANTTDDIANFGGSAGTVTLVSAGTPGGTLNLGGIVFTTANYTIGNGAGNGTLAFGAVAGSINSSAIGLGAAQATINSNLTGSAAEGITLAAHGDLSSTGGGSSAKFGLNGDNTGVVNGFKITSGLVGFANQAAAGNGKIVIQGGGIVQTISANVTLANPVEFASTTSVLRPYGAATLTLSGVVSGTGGLAKTDGGPVFLTGANTFHGPVRVHNGTLNIGSLNSVNGGTPLLASSHLGAPTTISEGTISLGGTATTAGVLNYTGTGETTDRVVNLAAPTGGGTLSQSGTGLLKFTSDFTATGAGVKTLTLQGSTAGTGEISGAIANGAGGTTTTTAAAVLGATTVTLATVEGVIIGSTISGTGIAGGTTVSDVNATTKVVTLSTPTTGAVANGASLAVSGLVNSTLVAKSGTGYWTLSGANTYTGPTTINATSGALIFGQRTALYGGIPANWTTNNIIVNSASTLGLAVGGPLDFTAADVLAINALGNATGGLKTGALLGLDTTHAPGGAFTYGNVVSNVGTNVIGFSKLGTGTLTLSGTNTYTGPTQVNGGTLAIGAAANLPAASAVAIGSGNTLALTGSSATYANAISGTGTLKTTAGAGGTNTLVLSGNLSGFTGTLDINPFASGGGKTAFTSNVQANTLPAAATVIIRSGGTLFSAQAVTYASSFQLYGGTTGETIGQVRLENATISGGVTLKNSATIGSNGAVGTISGVITDEGNTFNLTKQGAGTVLLNGANVYKGATSVTAGNLRATSLNSVTGGTASSSLGAPTTVANGTISLGSTTAGATLAYYGTGETTDRVINLAGSTGNGGLDQSGITGLLKFTSNLTAAAGIKNLVLQGSTAGTGEFAGAIGNGSGTVGLIKNGTGTWTLSGANTYTGATAANAGLLSIANAGALAGTGQNLTIAAGGAMAFDYNTSLQTILNTRISITSAGTIALTANNTLSENLDFSTPGLTLLGLGAKDNVTYTGAITQAGTTYRLGGGPGTLTLGTANQLTGNNDLIVGGNVTFGAPQNYTGTTTVNSGVFNSGGQPIDLSKIVFNGGTLTNTPLSGTGPYIKTGTNTVTFDSANTYTGGTFVYEGTLVATHSGAFSNGTVTLGNSTVTTPPYGNVRLGNGVVIPNPLTITANAGGTGRGVLEISTVSTNATWSGPITITATPGTGGHFFTDNTSTLSITGGINSTVPVIFRLGSFFLPNSTGLVYPSLSVGGTLKIGANDTLLPAAPVDLGTYGTGALDLNGFNQTLQTLTKGPNAGSVTNSAATASILTLAPVAPATFGGTIVDGTGGVSLVKNGAETLTLTGANTLTKGVTVNAGTLAVTAGSLANNATNTLTVNSGATFAMNKTDYFSGHTGTVNTPIILNGGTLSTTTHNPLGAITLNGGTLTSTGGYDANYNSFALKGLVSVIGNTTSTIASTGTNSNIHLGHAAVLGATFDVADGSQTIDLLASAVFKNGIAPTGGTQLTSSLTKTGAGTMVLSGANTYTGTTTISGGTLQVGNAGATGNLGAGAIVNNASLVFRRDSTTDLTVAGAISGTGSVTQSGAGTTILNGTNTYTGNTTVTNGVLTLKAVNPDNSGNVNIGGGAVLNLDFTGEDTINTLTLAGSPVVAGTWGSTSSTATHKTSLITGTGILNVSTTGSSVYSDWATAKQLTGTDRDNNQDPDHDGLNNLGEFAFDGEPLLGGATGKIVSKVVEISGQKVLTLTLPVRDGVTFPTDINHVGPLISVAKDGVIYRIEGSASLSSFGLTISEISPITANVTPASPGWTLRTFRTAGTMASDPKQFIRAKVVEP